MEPLRRDYGLRSCLYGLLGRPSGAGAVCACNPGHADPIRLKSLFLKVLEPSTAFSNSITLHHRPVKILCSCIVGAHLDCKSKLQTILVWEPEPRPAPCNFNVRKFQCLWLRVSACGRRPPSYAPTLGLEFRALGAWCGSYRAPNSGARTGVLPPRLFAKTPAAKAVAAGASVEETPQELDRTCVLFRGYVHFRQHIEDLRFWGDHTAANITPQGTASEFPKPHLP